MYIGNVEKVKMLATVTRVSHYYTCLGHLGCHDRDRIIYTYCHAAQGGQGKYSHMSLLLVLSR
jgi:hypothetical protein